MIRQAYSGILAFVRSITLPEAAAPGLDFERRAHPEEAS
jgi:hypothetical protein